ADYIAPEQAADARQADIRADIYALGCTLFHLLTGHPPFPAGSVQEKLVRHRSGPLPALREERPELPQELAAVVAKMTARKPADRYATPAGVAEALAPFASPTRRRRSLAATLCVLAAFACLLLLVTAILLRIPTGKGEILIQTDDRELEIRALESGEIVRIR